MSPFMLKQAGKRLALEEKTMKAKEQVSNHNFDNNFASPDI